MAEGGVITVSYGPAALVSKLVLPAWVRDPTTMPRTDDEDTVTITATRRYAKERWEIIPQKYKSTLFVVIRFAQGAKLVEEHDVIVSIIVPLVNFVNFSVGCGVL